PWEQLWMRSQAFIPKTTTLICGEAGHGKSLLILQAMAWWHKEGIRWCVYELEDDRTYHLKRALAQRTEQAGLLNWKWVAKHGIKTRELYKEHSGWLNDFGRYIWEAPLQAKTRGEIGDWIERRAEEGYRIICVDPVTMTKESENKNIWQEDWDLVERTKNIVIRYATSVVFITHPKKGQSKIACLDSLAGGTAYARHTHAVIWVERVDSLPVTIMDYTEPEQDINRKVHLLKTRNGTGCGILGFWLDESSLLLKEYGVIKKEKK
ncbi:hypothetical protein LCGC14_1374010, partial [marine sediment metagenome]